MPLHRTRRIFLLYFFGFTIYSLYCLMIEGSVVVVRKRSTFGDKAEYGKIAQNLSMNPKVQACRHPKLKLKDKELDKFIERSEPIVCDSEPDWICIESGIAYVCSETLINRQQVKCKFTFLKRESDYEVSEFEVVHVDDTEEVQLKSDFFRVKCKDEKGEKWENIMAGIHDDANIHNRAGKEHLHKSMLGLNVLIWGHDSVSRMTFMRKLPKTYKYLTEKLGAIVLKGYNAAGDGTLDNLIPILTGHKENELPNTKTKHFANVYPLIWKDFQNNGYVTAFAEDETRIGTFSFRLKGFAEQPTDHYMRTFFLVAEKEYDQHKKYCLRSTPRHKVVMNWIWTFISMYSDKPYFALSWLNYLSHGDYNLIGSVDEDLRKMVYLLQDSKRLNNTLLIIMSDHGCSFDGIRETQQGRWEERLPFFAFVFPPWFEKKYPMVIKNLQINADRLTTPYDIYPTLRNILYFEGTAMGDGMERGISLFKEIPLSRTCMDADVDPHWCTCLNLIPIDNTEKIVKMAAKYLVRFINEKTENKRELCEILKLDEVISAEKFSYTNDGDFSAQRKVIEGLYQVTIHTQPGEGHFQASLKYDPNNNSFSVKESDISRINRYGAAADCIKDTQRLLRKFCYCKKKL